MTVCFISVLYSVSTSFASVFLWTMSMRYGILWNDWRNWIIDWFLSESWKHMQTSPVTCPMSVLWGVMSWVINCFSVFLYVWIPITHAASPSVVLENVIKRYWGWGWSVLLSFASDILLHDLNWTETLQFKDECLLKIAFLETAALQNTLHDIVQLNWLLFFIAYLLCQENHCKPHVGAVSVCLRTEYAAIKRIGMLTEKHRLE